MMSPIAAATYLGHTLKILANQQLHRSPDADGRDLIELIGAIRSFVVDTQLLTSDFLGVKKMGRRVAQIAALGVDGVLAITAKEVTSTSSSRAKVMTYVLKLGIEMLKASRPAAPIVQVTIEAGKSASTTKAADSKDVEGVEAKEQEKAKKEKEEGWNFKKLAICVLGTLLVAASLSEAQAGAELADEIDARMQSILNRMTDGVFITGVTATGALGCYAEILKGSGAVINEYCRGDATGISIARELSTDLRDLGLQIDNIRPALVRIADKRRQAGLASLVTGGSMILHPFLPNKLKALAKVAMAVSAACALWKADMLAWNETRDARMIGAFAGFCKTLETKYQAEEKKAEMRLMIQKISARRAELSMPTLDPAVSSPPSAPPPPVDPLLSRPSPIVPAHLSLPTADSGEQGVPAATPSHARVVMSA